MLLKKANCSAKNVRLLIFFIVNNVNTCNKPKNIPDLMVAVYCYCLVQLKIVFGPRILCYDSGWFSAWQFASPAPEVLAKIKAKLFYIAFCALIYRLELSHNTISSKF